MGQKWRKIRRRCSSFNTGSAGKGKGSDGRGPLIPSTSSDDSATASPSLPSTTAVSAAATAVHDMLRARLNVLNIGNNKGRPPQRHHRTVAADTSSTFYVPSPLLSQGDDDDGGGTAGPCSLPVVFDLCPDQQQRFLRTSSLCRRSRRCAVDTPSSCGSSGRGTADDGAGSDRSSVSYSDHNSDAADR